MRELIKHEPKDKMYNSVHFNSYHMRQDQANQFSLTFEQYCVLSLLWVIYSQLFVEEIDTLKVENFKIFHRLENALYLILV